MNTTKKITTGALLIALATVLSMEFAGGMLLLFASLMLGLVKAESVRAVAEWLTGNMAIFFLPAAIGIMDLWGIVSASWWQWLLIVLLSTIAVMAASGWSQELAGKARRSYSSARSNKKEGKDE